MNTPEELAAIKAQVGAIERDLARLKVRLEALESQATSATGETDATAMEAGAGVVPPEIAEPSVPPLTTAMPPSASTPVLPPILESFQGAPPPLATEPALRASELPPKNAARWREWLEPLQLWPPSGEENAEVRLGAWWATRIGALLAVIGVVFLGLYVSRDSAPWLRLAEVIVVTAGVIGFGAWVERRLPKFGSVVFGAGLALAYFCAFAAYAVAPMKVIESRGVALGCELAVVGAIFAVAWWRGSQVVATMAVALGHVTAFLALRAETTGFGLWVVLLLGIAAVVLRFARRWDAPSVLAMPLAWLFLALAAFGEAGAGGLSVNATWFWAALYFGLYFARDWLPAWRGGGVSSLDRALQVTNSSLAVAIGWFAAAQVGGAKLTAFYFGSGVVMLLATFGWRRIPAGAPLASVFACKATGLFALGVIAAFDGHARYLVLLAQAFVMLVSARQSSVRGLRIATAIAGAVALSFFAAELRPENAVFASAATAVETVFLAGIVAFVAALRRWLRFDRTQTALGGGVVGLVAIAAVSTWAVPGWEPAVRIALGVLLAGAALALRGGLTAAVVGAMLLLAGHVAMWDFDAARFTGWQLWLNEGVLLASAGLAAVALGRSEAWVSSRGMTQLRGVLVAFAAATLVLVSFKAFSPAAGLALAAAVAAAMVASAERARGWPVAALGAPVLGGGLLLFGLGGNRGADGWLVAAAVLAWLAPAWLVAVPARLETIGARAWRELAPATHSALATWLTLVALHENLRGEWRVVALVAAALIVFALAWRPGLRAALESAWVIWLAVLVDVSDVGATGASWIAVAASWLPALALVRPEVFGPIAVPPPAWRRSAAGVQVLLATLIGAAMAVDAKGALRIAAFGGVVAMAVAAWRWGGVAAARRAALALAAAGWVMAVMFAHTAAAQGWRLGLAMLIAAGVGLAALPFTLERDVQPAARRRVRWWAAVGALLLVFYSLALQRGAVAAYATIGWGLAAVAMFLAGLFARSRPHRLTGLAGLACCVPRAFVVDLDSTLHRIAAFVALGVVLLWVGFSYHRFRHLIADEEKRL